MGARRRGEGRAAIQSVWCGGRRCGLTWVGWRPSGAMPAHGGEGRGRGAKVRVPVQQASVTDGV